MVSLDPGRARKYHPRLFRMRMRLWRKAHQILERVLMHIALDAKELGWDAGRRLAVLAVSEVICNLERDIEPGIQECEGLLSAREAQLQRRLTYV